MAGGFCARGGRWFGCRRSLWGLGLLVNFVLWGLRSGCLTVGVVEGDEVEVVVVQEGCHVSFSGLVAVDELVCEVFDYLWMLVTNLSTVGNSTHTHG